MDRYLTHFTSCGLPPGVERAFAELASENDSSVLKRLENLASNKILVEEFWPKYEEVVRRYAGEEYLFARSRDIILVALSKGGRLKTESDDQIIKRRERLVQAIGKVIELLDSHEEYSSIDLHYLMRLCHDNSDDQLHRETINNYVRSDFSFVKDPLSAILVNLVREILKENGQVGMGAQTYDLVKVFEGDSNSTNLLAPRVFYPRSSYPFQDKKNLTRFGLFRRVLFHHFLNMPMKQGAFDEREGRHSRMEMDINTEICRLIATLEVLVFTKESSNREDVLISVLDSWKDYEKRLDPENKSKGLPRKFFFDSP